MLIAVLSGFVLALLAPRLHQLAGRWSGWLFAILPAWLAVYFGAELLRVASGTPPLDERWDWVPTAGVSIGFFADGLSLVFATLIAGIGALICIYAGRYLEGDPQLGRFFGYLLFFMGAMLGLVLADSLLGLYLFWELTTVSSFLLIGYDHAKEKSRKAALDALLVTVIGGLALLAGFILLGEAAGTYVIPEILDRREVLAEHPHRVPIALLLLLGAFTKSAQFPFHFWLPSAMAAPTPASAYLHSSTMVKAGLYLVARLGPVFGAISPWPEITIAGGGLTMLLGALYALMATELKAILAWTTVMVLGMIMLLFGLGSPEAVAAAVTYLVAHAFYKAALFMVAGAITHATGEKDTEKVRGLGRVLPIPAAAALLALAGAAGLPPVLGFIAKEKVYEAAEHGPEAVLLVVLLVTANTFMVAATALAALLPFAGRLRPSHVTPTPPSLWLGALLLGVLGVIFGLWHGPLEGVLGAMASAILAAPVQLRLPLWKGLDMPIVLSGVTLLGAAALFFGRHAARRAGALFAPLGRLGPARLWARGLGGLRLFASWLSGALQSGHLRRYTRVLMAVTTSLLLVALIGREVPTPLSPFPRGELWELVVLALVVASAAVMPLLASRMSAVVVLGVVGAGVVAIFVIYGAPDVAMTQAVVEMVSIILFALVLLRMRPQRLIETWGVKMLDAALSLAFGTAMALVLLATLAVEPTSRVSAYFAREAVAGGHGRNVVNVILVDFRVLDTLGEITVLALAASGIYILLQLRRSRGGVA